jgi:hypothetical protein
MSSNCTSAAMCDSERNAFLFGTRFVLLSSTNHGPIDAAPERESVFVTFGTL